ncbi:MAG: 4Fe-4S binding protein [Pirellulaceae bacterium]
MITLRRLGMTHALALLLVRRAAGELIPVPDFSNHPIPTSQLPDATVAFWEYLDVAALFMALCLATYWALVTRSRRNLFLLTIGSLLWFGFWRKGCVCAIGATQNITLAMFQSDYVVPLSVVLFFVLPLIFTLFFGRTFCASVCPLGAVQELVTIRSIQVPRWLDHALSLLAYVYLGAAVLFAATGTAFLICRYDPYVAIFRFNGNANIVILGGCLLLIGLFVGRPYCRYLCPYGAILGVVSKFSKWHLRIPPDACIQCRLCEDVCPYGAIQPPSAELTPADRERGKRRLGFLLLLAPVLIGLLGWLGTLLAVPLSHLDPEVQLAEQLRREDLGLTDTMTDASEAFRNARHSVSDLYQATLLEREQFRWLGGALGVWVGLVVSIKLISLSIRRRRDEFLPNRTGCVSCGRCFWYCPVEQVRLGLIENTDEVVKAE